MAAADADADDDLPSGEALPLLASGSDSSAVDEAARGRRRAELRATVLMVVAGAMVNGGYNPTEIYRAAVFGPLGYYSSFVLYFCMSLGNLFVPAVVARWSLRSTMVVGSACYVPFVLVFALALATGWGEPLFLPTAAALGLGASAFRTTQVTPLLHHFHHRLFSPHPSCADDLRR